MVLTNHAKWPNPLGSTCFNWIKALSHLCETMIMVSLQLWHLSRSVCIHPTCMWNNGSSNLSRSHLPSSMRIRHLATILKKNSHYKRHGLISPCIAWWQRHTLSTYAEDSSPVHLIIVSPKLPEPASVAAYPVTQKKKRPYEPHPSKHYLTFSKIGHLSSMMPRYKYGQRHGSKDMTLPNFL